MNKYIKKIKPIVQKVEDIPSPVFFKSWAPEAIPEPDDAASWRDIFEECDGIAMTEEFNLTDESGDHLHEGDD